LIEYRTAEGNMMLAQAKGFGDQPGAQIWGAMKRAARCGRPLWLLPIINLNKVRDNLIFVIVDKAVRVMDMLGVP